MYERIHVSYVIASVSSSCQLLFLYLGKDIPDWDNYFCSYYLNSLPWS